jgi:hypothetical protein
MIKIEKKRAKNHLSSRTTLLDHCFYLQDPSHPDHKGKLLVPSRNWNCPDDTVGGFINSAVECKERYNRTRIGRRGKPSNRLWEEVIYSTPPMPEGKPPSQAKRDSIASLLLEEICPDSVARYAWHIDNTTGRADLHILLAAKTRGFPPGSTLWEDHGGKDKPHLLGHFDKIDQRIAKRLGIKSAKDVRNEKLREKGIITDSVESLAHAVAAGGVPLDDKTLEHFIIRAGAKVTRQTKRTISVLIKGRKQARNYNKRKLIKNINNIISKKQAKETPTRSVEPLKMMTSPTIAIIPPVAQPSKKAPELAKKAPEPTPKEAPIIPPIIPISFTAPIEIDEEIPKKLKKKKKTGTSGNEEQNEEQTM